MPRVAIIGAGASGLVSAKNVREQGLEPVVFEKAAELGGLWHPESGSTWKSMQANLSKFTCMFSDFPWEPHKAIFPSQQQLHEYLVAYAKEYKLDQFVQFNSCVKKVTKQSDKWLVEWSGQEGDKKETFDYVIVATGIFSKPHIPEFPNLEKFKGDKIHSQNYKSPEQLAHKKVLVVGNSFSGAEIAADIATHAKSLINLIKRPYWILPRYIPVAPSSQTQLPVDLVFYNRSKRKKLEEITIRTPQENQGANTYMSGLCGKQNEIKELGMDAKSQEPSRVAISDTYLEKIKQKNITIQIGEIKEFIPQGVILQDGTRLEIDAVVFCTGYQLDMSFLDDSILKAIDFKPQDQLQPMLTYKSTFHPELPGLAFVGVYRGPYFSVIELQARWASLVFGGKVSIPAKEKMLQGILEEGRIREQIPRPQFPHGDYVGFADSIAKEFGALPDFTDAQNKEAYNNLWQGPVLPSHYRVVGPGADAKAAHVQIQQASSFIEESSHHAQCTIKENDTNKAWTTKSLRLAVAGLTFGLGAVVVGYKILTRDKSQAPSLPQLPGLKL